MLYGLKQEKQISELAQYFERVFCDNFILFYINNTTNALIFVECYGKIHIWIGVS